MIYGSNLHQNLYIENLNFPMSFDLEDFGCIEYFLYRLEQACQSLS
jgi:hypothetical protein